MSLPIRCYFTLLFLGWLSACAPVTMNQLAAEGNTPLSETQLRDLLTDRTLHLEAIDFDGQVQYQANGRLSAASLQGAKDNGKWNITSANQLCMKFGVWYFGDVKCYKIIKDKNQYLFFTTNGARYYTGEISDHRDELAGQNQAENAPPKTQSQQAPPAPKLTQAERDHALLSVARNCPGCNFAGVDLRGAQLIAANLAGANLSEADLSDANLRRANLAGADLSGAKLARSNLAGADLTNADLTDADLTGSNLIRANVTGAKLQGAILTAAHLESIQGFKE